ncbi:MAG: hypothetical protein ABIK98_10915 [Pseudomonadota bacterium]|uniref:Uncharacterized protein n=1 Tax=Candidatus Desulfatibia profunda TaxID=2841695 RepID=A0A8J6NLL9_9BACT|nr:hypothetical protein [Candidatus Desulfatibia profunda]MBL7179102.1 hypothetical protein [Desulfobacterales bacterium]
MSKQHPECPLYNHLSCKEIDNPKVCALVRDDKTCLRELPKSKEKNRTTTKGNNEENE